MKKILAIIFAWLIPVTLFAHPGIGLVQDSKGNIFYTDLKQVWKITPDGIKSIAVPGVHTHELSIDAHDNLYGEHLWYNGEKADTWGHYTWCLKNDSTLVKDQSREGFLENYGFLRDSSGNMYWIERFTISKFKKKSPGGIISTIAEGKFRNIRWSYCTKGGTVYFIDLHKLYKLTPGGQFILLASNLDDGKLAFGFSRQHNVYGLWVDHIDNIYVAIMPAKKVKRISPSGKIDVVYYSNGKWSPVNGLFDKAGNLWLLECEGFGNCGVTKVANEKLIPMPNIQKPVFMNFVFVFSGLLVITIFTFGILKLRKRIRRKYRFDIRE